METTTVKRADWQHDPHAYECYTCDQRGTAPRGNSQCTGCINRPTRPHWRPHPDYAHQAADAIALAAKPCAHVWEDESSSNGWRETCRRCGQQARGSGQ